MHAMKIFIRYLFYFNTDYNKHIQTYIILCDSGKQCTHIHLLLIIQQ